MHKVIKVTPLDKHKLKLLFANGVEKIIDISPYISDRGISADLNDVDLFRQVSIESGGGIYWPNGFDFCPNFLHDEVQAVDKSPV